MNESVLNENTALAGTPTDGLQEGRQSTSDEISGVAPSLRFPKRDKLRHRSLVEGLFAGGKSLFEYPLRAQWRYLTADRLQENFKHGLPRDIAPLQMMVTVPKKKRRRAVDRVLMRRRIREAFRLNRSELRQFASSLPEGGSVQVAFIYLHDKNADYKDVEKAMIKLLDLLRKKLQKQINNPQTPPDGQS